MTTNDEDKLRRGFALMGRAEGDPALLGAALLAIHGAVEDVLREQISARQDLPPQERRAVDEVQISGAPLLNLVRRYLTLGPDQLAQLQRANTWRRTLAHGDPLDADASNIFAYAQFAERYCDRLGLLEEVAGDPQSYATTASIPVYRSRRPLISAGAVITIFLLSLLLLGGAWLYRQLNVPQLIATLNDAPAPEATSSVSPTPLPPTPEPRRGRVVRLDGGPGWLHESPSFSSPTLPVRLGEGDIVILNERQQTDLDGNPWIYVGINGYDGWSPANNIEAIP